MSQPPHPQTKRRRLENAASALSRPFKSPLPKLAQRKEATSPDNANTEITQSQMVIEQHTPTQTRKPPPSMTPSSPYLNIKTGGPDSDLEILSLRKERLSLQCQLTSLRTELDIAQQALRIESSARDDELRILKTKWRSISQKAAEELFEAAKDKIERMGGVVAWKENERQRVRRMLMWEDDAFHAGNDHEERGKGDDGFDNYEVGGGGGREGGEEEMFTMDMMLKSLNIEPGMIGFDTVEKRWKSE